VLTAAQRIRRRAEFAAVIRGGRRAGRGPLVVHVALPREPVPAGEHAPPARAGFVVPKTVGNAVARNLVRRRLRHLVRDHLPEQPAGTMIVVRVQPGAADLTYSELRRHLGLAIEAAYGRAGAASGSRGRR
jgi:ribonuclease P protein component